MRITRPTLYAALARSIGPRIEAEALLCHADLAARWISTGLRSADLDLILQELYEQQQMDRTIIGSDTWYRLTAEGAKTLQRYHQDVWSRVKYGITLFRAQLRPFAADGIRAKRRRRSDVHLARQL